MQKIQLRSEAAWVRKQGDTALIVCPRVGSETIRRVLGYYVRRNPMWVGQEFEASRIAYFVRNPYDRAVSQWNLYPTKRRKKKKPSFERFLNWMMKGQSDRHWWTQTEYFSTDDGLVEADFLGRLENMSEDWERFLEWSGWGAEPLGHAHKSSPGDPYTPETRDMVREFYKDDFINFGYGHDSRG